MGLKAVDQFHNMEPSQSQHQQNIQSPNDFCKHQGKALDQNDEALMVVAYSTMAAQGNENHD